jgi:hypothetical protein
MFGKKKPAATVAAPTPAPAQLVMSAEDYELLSDIGAELLDCLTCADGSTLVEGAHAVSLATLPVPVLEIEYPDMLVSLRLEVYRYTAEEMAENGGEA